MTFSIFEFYMTPEEIKLDEQKHKLLLEKTSGNKPLINDFLNPKPPKELNENQLRPIGHFQDSEDRVEARRQRNNGQYFIGRRRPRKANAEQFHNYSRQFPRIFKTVGSRMLEVSAGRDALSFKDKDARH